MSKFEKKARALGETTDFSVTRKLILALFGTYAAYWLATNVP